MILLPHLCPNETDKTITPPSYFHKDEMNETDEEKTTIDETPTNKQTNKHTSYTGMKTETQTNKQATLE
jgi:hypothetical protein